MVVEPVVEYRLCPIALVPSSFAMIVLLKTSATSPIRRCEISDLPLDDTIPADSCPRCCCAWRPRYARLAASGSRYTPNTPHSSWKTSRFDSSTAMTECVSVTASEPPWNRVFVNSLQFGNVLIETGRRGNLEPGIGDYASDDRKFQSSPRKQTLDAGCVALSDRQHHRRCALTKKVNRGGVPSAPKFNFGSQNRPRIETGFGQCHRKAALGDIVRRSYQPLLGAFNQPLDQRCFARQVDRAEPPAVDSENCRVLARRQSRRGRAHDRNRVAGILEELGNVLRDVDHHAQHRNRRRRRNRVAFGLVVQAHVAADHRRAERDRRVAPPLDAADEP